MKMAPKMVKAPKMKWTPKMKSTPKIKTTPKMKTTKKELPCQTIFLLAGLSFEWPYIISCYCIKNLPFSIGPNKTSVKQESKGIIRRLGGNLLRQA